MDWNEVEGSWKQLRGAAKDRWGKLTDDHFLEIAGKRDRLIGKIQQLYGVQKDEAERQVEEWGENLSERVSSHV